MSFATEFDSLPLGALVRRAQEASTAAARASLASSAPGLTDFAHLISPAAGELLEAMGRRSHRLTQKRFGKVIR
ncbi:MAG TPA: 2-iminoacetate synthase ThiH, partial [Clostridia bacterium]|nr:2-iminoacetate synthase ThiH [Clostridia bacterium]